MGKPLTIHQPGDVRAVAKYLRACGETESARIVAAAADRIEETEQALRPFVDAASRVRIPGAIYHLQMSIEDIERARAVMRPEGGSR